MEPISIFILLVILLVPLALLAVPALCCILGHVNEKKHLESLATRENANKGFLLSTFPNPTEGDSGVTGSEFVTGSAVISSDLWKDCCFKYVNLFGGESKSFTRMYNRAHREAVQRMIELAKGKGYNAICNIRFDSMDITGAASQNSADKNGGVMRAATCIASGTAYKR